MKRLKTSETGGYPFTLNRVDNIQLNVKNITSAIAKGLSFNEPAFRLFGAEISVTNSGGASPLLNITEGAIWYLDEIFLVDAVSGQSLPSGTTLQNVLDTYEWDLNTVDSEVKLFKDNTSKATVETKTAILTATPATWTNIEANLITYENIIKENTNLDTLNLDYENPDDFTILSESGTLPTVYRYRQYQVSKGQHVANWYTPETSTAN